jgi:hypothetical protein
MGVSGQRHIPAALPPGKRPDKHFTGGRVASEPVWRGTEYFPSPGFEYRAVETVASHYTGYAIPAAFYFLLLEPNKLKLVITLVYTIQ